MPHVTVPLGDRSYEVHIENGALSRVARFVPKGMPLTRALLVSDENVAPLYAQRVLDSFKAAGFHITPAVIPAGEVEKNLQRVEFLYHKMIAAGLDRRSLAVALGGGVVGDITGFAAATYMRGIPFMQVPTTILSQVDSSVGGKTGVDLPEGKNLVGAFHQPIAVVIDPDTLTTLPEREVRSGLAEVVKHGVIRDEDYFALLEREGKRLLHMDPAIAERVILRSVQIKAQVVSADERELGLRAILNFGHTVAHALETVTGYTRYLHGEAVAIGMVAAAEIALAQSLCAADVPRRIRALLTAVGLPVAPVALPASQIIDAMARDKKAFAGKARLVLPQRIGSVAVFDEVAPAVLKNGLSAAGFAA